MDTPISAFLCSGSASGSRHGLISSGRSRFTIRIGAAQQPTAPGFTSLFTTPCSGYPDQGLHAIRQAITDAEESAHPFTLTDVFQWAAVLHQLRREGGPTMDAADAALTLANEHIFPFLGARATALRGWALVPAGLRQGRHRRPSAGASMPTAGPAQILKIRIGSPCLPNPAARPATSRRGCARSARRSTMSRRPASSITRRNCIGSTANCGWPAIPPTCRRPRRAFSARSRSRAASRQNPGNCAPPPAWRGCGAIRAEAPKRTIYGWFTEGFDTADLKDAAALLSELA